MTNNSIFNLARDYAKVRETREKLDKLAAEAKKKEDMMKSLLVSEMSAQQMPSVKFDGIGRFVLRNSRRYDINDIELVCRAMLARMVDNSKNGRQLSDGLLLQKRTAKNVLDELVETNSWQDSDLSNMGLTVAEKCDLTFTK